MPNHITNILKASPEVLAKLKSESQLVDFSSVIPIPEKIKSAVAEGTATGLAELLTGQIQLRPGQDDILAQLKLTNVLRDISERGGIKAFQTDESFENFIQLLRNFREHGFLTWHDWSCQKWGTKWNAYQVSERDGGLRFETAWSAPHPVIAALAGLFPDEKIEHLWADEDIGSNLGRHIYHFGAVTEMEVEDPVDFALTVTGHERDYYRKDPETGKWAYHDEDEAETSPDAAAE